MKKRLLLGIILGVSFTVIQAGIVYGVSGPFGLGTAPTTSVTIAQSEVTGFDVSISPNPFNPSTRLSVQLVQTGPLKVTVYNLKGEKVRTLENRTAQAGTHVTLWNGKNDAGFAVGSGVYLVRVEAGRLVKTKNVTYLK